jgi:hypothetical protein
MRHLADGGLMDIVKALVSSGHIVDVALMFIAIEFGVLLLRAPRGNWTDRIVQLVLALGPGACLMLALRCALTNAAPLWIAFWLSMSLPLHIADVLKRRL